MPIRKVLLPIILFYSTAANVVAEPRASKILVIKNERKMELFSGAKVIRTYKIALGGSPVGPKRQQGDHKTPEGKYVISGRNDKSSYHLSLRVSYPNQSDKKQASTRGVKTGSDIMIHGLPNGMGSIGSAHLLQDWTDGCIAVTDEEMEEIWKLVSVGTEIEILP